MKGLSFRRSISTGADPKNQIFVVEVKCVDNSDCNPKGAAQEALLQIRDRRYADDKHTCEGSSVYAVAMIFGRLERNVLHIIIEDLDKG